MTARCLAVRVLAVALLLSAIPIFGCSPRAESTTIVIPIRDDCAPADVEAIQSRLLADKRVASCNYVSENVTLTQEASAAATLTPGPDGDPWHEAWFEVVVTAESRDAVLASLESQPEFERVVRVSEQGEWWQVR